MTLVLPADVRDSMVEHARAGAPEEVVGVLAGQRGDDESTVERHHAAENAASRPETRYEIDPAEELELLERVDDAGLDVVGFYHSHPQGPLAPSETDARLAAWPRYSYVIVSLGEARGTSASGNRVARDRRSRRPCERSTDREQTGSGATRETGRGESPELGSWRWTGEAFEREPVEVR